MPEPVTIIVVGSLAYAWWKGRTNRAVVDATNPGAPGGSTSVAPSEIQPLSTGASGTGPDAPLATNTAIVNAVPIADVMTVPVEAVPVATPDVRPVVQIVPVPSLAAVLDNDTALKLRMYAALDPEGLRVFLNRYAQYFQLRSDMYIDMLTTPPPQAIEPTPGMIVSMGAAAYKVAQALNGVAAGQTVDVFGLASSVAGQIPGVDPGLLKSLQGLALGYRAYNAALTVNSLSSIAAANGVGLMDLTASMAPASAIGAPIASFAGVLMAVGLCVDIAFTIIGDAPDLQKAIDIALDVASLVCLFIPVVGWVIAIVIQLVKFIIDCFADDLFGSGLSHNQREQIETARYSEALSPMFPILANSYSPRELFRHIVEWGSGYCGGVQTIAMAVSLILHPGDSIVIKGHAVTIITEEMLGFGNQGCYWHTGIFQGISNDEQAWALAKYGAINGVQAVAQAGIADWRKDQFNNPTEQLIKARTTPMRQFVEHGVTLDGMDMIVAEYRAQPGLNALATFYRYDTWQAMLGDVLNTEWQAWASSITHGALSDFARALGFPTMAALRSSALASYQTSFDKVQVILDQSPDLIGAFNHLIGSRPMQTLYGYQPSGPITENDYTGRTGLDLAEAYVSAMERAMNNYDAMAAQATQWQQYVSSMPSM